MSFLELRLILLLLSLSSLMASCAHNPASDCLYEVNCQCSSPGETKRWEFAYCMNKLNTSNAESASVKTCVSSLDRTGLRGLSSCEVNAHWRSKICDRPKERFSCHDSCMKSERSIPPVILKGIW